MNLRELRYSKGLQRKFVAEHINISGKHLNDIEKGKVNLTDKMCKKLSKFYGIGEDEIKLMYLEGKNSKNEAKCFS
ncbi:MAG: helix-turn-helix transcriptional regulator [Caloramator sp.]|nr:helix-turn-helix transcriptional regulator [Caloramator sp.]